MLFDAAGVTRSLGWLLSVLTDRLFEFFGHGYSRIGQHEVAYLESYPVEERSDERIFQNQNRVPDLESLRLISDCQP